MIDIRAIETTSLARRYNGERRHIALFAARVEPEKKLESRAGLGTAPGAGR